MSWPSVWQTQNQVPSQGAQATNVNMGMYLTAEQQYALQQQNWQQWQMYQTQLAQWQAQYGERYQQMQNDMMGGQSGHMNMVQNAFMQSVAPPPPPMDQPPPPPPPQQTNATAQENTQSTAAAAQNLQQNPSTSYEANMKEQQQQQQTAHQNMHPKSTNIAQNINQNEPFHTAQSQAHRQNTNFEQSNYSNYSQQNQDGFRRNNNRNNRWNNGNNGNNRNNRPFGGNNFNNRNMFDRDEPMFNDAQQNDEFREEKSDEEVAFDIQYQKWEDSFMEWKRSNANHPDQNQYNDFVVKMEGCRMKLLQRREALKQKRLDAQRKSQNNQRSDNRMDFYEDQQEQRPEMDHKPDEQQQEEEQEQNQGNVTTGGDFVKSSTSSSFFTNQSGNMAGIPGLDLVSERKVPIEKPFIEKHPVEKPPVEKPPVENTPQAPKPEPNIVEHVNNILGNPEIQSLLSNIQKQQNVQEKPKVDNIKMEDDFQRNSDAFNRFGNTSHFDQPQNNELPQRNQFRNDNRYDADMSQSQYHNDQFDNKPKRGRIWNENSSNDVSHLDRDRNNFQQQPQSNQNFEPNRFENSRKRPRELDTFKAANNQFHDDRDEFRPMHVIDYQNRSQNQLPFSNQSPFSGNQSSFSGNQSSFSGNQSSFPGSNPFNRLKSEEIMFPRKVVEYDHKSKTHSWKWFCPIVQIEYNHGKNGFSLHEHPPPRRVEEFRNEEPHRFNQQSKDDFKQLRQPKWAQTERDRGQDRFSHGMQGPHGQYQSRYDNRQNTQQPEPHYRRNQPEKSWIRNNRGDWNNPHTYDRCPEPRNIPPRGDFSTLPNTSSSSSSLSTYHPKETSMKVESPIKCDIKDLLFLPGRKTRPKKIVILMRGVPGSGKSFISKMIKEKENAMSGSARILSIDDYFMTENETSSYEYDAEMEETYTQYLLKSFKKTLIDNLFNCVIVDCRNTTLLYLNEFYAISKIYFFTPYICEMPRDLEKCLKNNIHNRSESDIRKAIAEWVPTPSSYTVLDYECLVNSADDTEEISDVDDEKAESLDAISDDDNSNAEKDYDSDIGGDDEPINEFGCLKSKWDNDTTENKMARLDGINKPMKHTTFEDYLQMDGWEPPPTSTNGKKRVRWADLEEKREQDKQRAIGFVVGQTNWSNLIDQPRDHSQALTKVKYIEKVRKN